MQPQSPYQPQGPQTPQGPPQPGQTVSPYAAPQPPLGPPQPPLAPQPYTQPQQTPVQPQQQPYDFIMNPPAPPKKPLFGGFGGSLLARVGLVGGGLVLLLIIFTVLQGFFKSEPPLDNIVTIAQDQQQLIHLSTGAMQQQNLTTSIKNFAATTQVTVTSSQSSTSAYLTENGKKVNVKELNLGIDPALDERLKTAAAATTYNQTFQEIMKAQLTEYMSHLEQAYEVIKGPKGQQLLRDQYQQAKLLLEQVDQAAAPTD